jgi:CelD/BcsL family acetyltransferase involved in cellulose biosynthesis
LGEPDPETYRVMVKELLLILKQRKLDILYFNHVRTDSMLCDCLKQVSVLRMNQDKHWQTILPDSAQEFYGQSSSRRRYIKRYSKEIEKVCGGQLELCCCTREEEIEELVAESSAISEATYKKVLNVGLADNKVVRSMLVQGARQQRLRSYLLKSNNRTCAFMIGQMYGRIYFPEHVGYDPQLYVCSPGSVLFLKVFEELIQNTAVRIFDYGFGDAVYK